MTGAPILVRVGGQTWRATPDRPWTIGRAEEADVHLDNPRISRSQATLEFTPDGWVLVNHSRNGMFVGGSRVERLALQGPATVYLGSPSEGVILHLHPKRPR
ncbi:FHA domain-containing protein [Mycobacterium sp.]|uniref:FHA domain-containing protein n=1 Tax=Mycobacterium sp. TaxID=1785 RepID=UPI003F9CACA4